MSHHRSKDWTRLGHGVYRPTPDTTLAAQLRAWEQWLPEAAVFTGVTACRAWGLWLPSLPAGAPIDVAVPLGSSRPRQLGLRATRLADMPIAWAWEGVRVASVAEALLSAGRVLCQLDLMVAVDSALHRQLISESELGAYAGQRRAGAVALRRALKGADGRSESPYESLLRLFHGSVGIAVTPQVNVRDARGAFIARADLMIDGTRTLQEYDGAGHREKDTYRKDRRRDAGLAAAGYVRHGWVREDLIPDGAAILAAADAAVGRRHRPERLEIWREALRDSGYGRRKWSEVAA